MKVRGIGKEGMVVRLAVIVIALVVFSGVAIAQPSWDKITLSDPIKISAEPVSISADGISTSRITISAFWPKMEDHPKLSEIEGYENISGTPAGNTPVVVKTTLGELTDAEDMNSTGKDITAFTGDNGVATVLLAGDETGVANITVTATGIGDMMNTMIGNETTGYIVKNSTTVTLLEAGTTPTPENGGGNGGIPPTPPAGTSHYLNLVANPADITADGISTSTITASVWNGDEWVLENLTVNFSTSLGTITSSAVIVNGTAVATLTAGMEEGAATITGEANLGGDIGTVTNTTTVNFMAPGATPTPTVLTPTPTVTISPTPTVTPSATPTSEPLIPGFEAVFAIAGLLAVASLVLQRRKA